LPLSRYKFFVFLFSQSTPSLCRDLNRSIKRFV
jgi:hypothetical protein